MRLCLFNAVLIHFIISTRVYKYVYTLRGHEELKFGIVCVDIVTDNGTYLQPSLNHRVSIFALSCESQHSKVFQWVNYDSCCKIAQAFGEFTW